MGEASDSKSGMKAFEGFIVPLGALFQGILFWLVGSYAMFYYTDVVGFAPAAVGTLILVARIWDGINDPIFGFIADKTRTRWGKFRPYLIFGPFFVSLFAVMIFTVPNMGAVEKFIYASVTYVLFSMAYTVVDVPLWASPSILSRDNLTVTTVVSRVQLFATVGSIVASILTMLLVGWLGGVTQDGFRNTAIVYGIFAFAVTVAAGLLIRERVEPKNKEERVTLRGAARVIFQNKYLVIAMTSSVLALVTMTLKVVAVPYYATYNLDNIDLVPLIMIVVSIPGLVGFMIAPKLVRLYGKRNPTLVTLLLSILFSFAAYFAGYGNFVLILVLQAMISFFMFIAMVIMTTMFADSVVYADSRHGIRTEGIIFSFRTLSGKIAAALATFLSGVILTIIGYVAGSAQTETVLNGLHATVTTYPGIILALCIVPLLFYDLTQERITEMSVAGNVRAGGGAGAS